MNAADLMGRLSRALADVDAECHPVPADGAASRIAAWLGGQEVRTAALTTEPLWEALQLPETLKAGGLEVISPPAPDAARETIDRWRAELAGADAGITSALGIAAETGSALLPALLPDQRAVSLLPDLHLIVIPEERVVEDIAGLMRLFTGTGDAGGNAVIVTGPSRTADIEKELVLGVHGPRRVAVFVLQAGEAEP